MNDGLPTTIDPNSSGLLNYSFYGNSVLDWVQAAVIIIGALVLGRIIYWAIGKTVKLIAEIMERQIEIQTDDQRVRPQKSEVERLWADNSKAKAVTGWSPRYGGIDGFRQGLKETVNWFTSPGILEKYKVNAYNL